MFVLKSKKLHTISALPWADIRHSSEVLCSWRFNYWASVSNTTSCMSLHSRFTSPWFINNSGSISVTFASGAWEPNQVRWLVNFPAYKLWIWGDLMKLWIFSCLRVHVLTICSQERDDRGSLNHNGIYWSGSIRDSRVTTSQIEETGNNLNSVQRLESVNTTWRRR